MILLQSSETRNDDYFNLVEGEFFAVSSHDESVVIADAELPKTTAADR